MLTFATKDSPTETSERLFAHPMARIRNIEL